MRSVSSAEADRNFDVIGESVVARGAQPVAIIHDNMPQVVVMTFDDYQNLLRKTRFAGTLADLSEDDRVFLATLDERNT